MRTPKKEDIFKFFKEMVNELNLPKDEIKTITFARIEPDGDSKTRTNLSLDTIRLQTIGGLLAQLETIYSNLKDGEELDFGKEYDLYKQGIPLKEIFFQEN